MIISVHGRKKPKSTDGGTPPVDTTPASITITPTSYALAVGATRPQAAVVKNQAGQELSIAVTWHSSNTSALAIDPTTGVATGVAPGATVITASIDTLTSNHADVTVPAPPVDTTPASLSLTPTPFSLAVGQTITLLPTIRNAAGTLLGTSPTGWDSSNTAVLQVNSSGVVTAVGAGAAVITASAGTVNGTAAGVVSSPVVVPDTTPASVTVTPTPFTLNHGQSITLGAAIRNAAGTLLGTSPDGWASSDTAVLQVSPSGVVTAVGLGTAVITASAGTVHGTASGTVVPLVVTPPPSSPSTWDGGSVEVWDDLGAGIPSPSAEPTGVLLCNFTPPIVGGFGVPDGSSVAAQIGTLSGTTFRSGTPKYVVLRNEDDTTRIITAVGGGAGQVAIAGGTAWDAEHIVTLSLGAVSPTTYTGTVTYGAIRKTPEGPRLVVDLDFSHVVPSGGTYAATSWSDLAAALWADPDRTFTIPAGLAVTDNVVIRKAPGHEWSRVRFTGTLPADGTVATADVATAHNYPVITQGSGGFGAALRGSTVDGEVPYKILFEGIRCTVAPNQQTAFVHTDSLVAFTPSGNLLRQQPHRILFNKCCFDVPDTSDCHTVVTLVGRHMGGKDCYGWGGHDGDSVRGSRDSQALAFNHGTGPYTFDNWIIAATDEPIAAGGVDSSYRQIVTADVTLTRICSQKPRQWYDGSTGVVPKNFKCNGLYEFKTTERTLALDIIIDHTHTGQQLGSGIQNWSVNQGGGQPWARSQNHTVDRVWMRNVTVLAGIGKWYAGFPSLPNGIVAVRNIAATGFGSTTPATDVAFYLTQGVHGIDISNVIVDIPNAAGVGYPGFAIGGLEDYRDMTWRNLMVRLVPGNLFVMFGAGANTLGSFGLTMSRSVIAGETNGAGYRVGEGANGNQYVSSFDAELVNAATLADPNAKVGDLLNLAIKSTSALKGTGDDGNDPGPDVVTLHANILSLATQAGLA